MIRRALGATSCAALMFAAFLPALAQDEPQLDPGWPREKTTEDGHRIVLYQPQVDTWDRYVDLEARIAAQIFPPGEEEGIPAALRIEASTTTDFTTRTVLIYDAELTGARFPSSDDETAAKLTELLASTISIAPVKISLDRILAYYDETIAEKGEVEESPPVPPKSPVRTTEVKPDPPSIVYSTKPASLVMFDGEPIFVPVEGAGLMTALNTNWDVFKEEGEESFFLLLDDGWLRAGRASGPWEPAGKLPKGLRLLPDTPEWEEVKKHLPGEEIFKDDMPRLYVSFRPAELIVLDGAPEKEPIGETGISWIANTESDLFFVPPAESESGAATQGDEGAYYFLVSGRWFRTDDPVAGEWEFASDALPAGFADIPEDHPRGRVRVSVPGTPEAREAILLAQVPRTAEVKRVGVTVQVEYDGQPRFVEIEGTDVSYAVNTKYDVFRVGLRYYACHEAIWFVAEDAKGPWAVAAEVPDELYQIPPSSPKHNVTYVEVYDATPDVVVTGYTSGYWGLYVSWGCVVFGTGWYYPPYSYWGPYSYPYYYAYPYSYGVAAWYNPYTGMYGRGASVHGPYGGYGWGRSYNPSTGAYSRGVAAYGPYQAGYAREAYDPRSGTYAATYQRANPYESWGESVVRRGDDWIHTGHYANEDGALAGFETSEGGKGVAGRNDEGDRGFVGKDSDNNLYAGGDGNVYRRDDDGNWSKYGDDGWENVERPSTTEEGRARTQDRAAEAGVDREQAADRAGQARESAESREGDRTGRDKAELPSRDAGTAQRESRGAGDRSAATTGRDVGSGGQSSGERSYGAKPEKGGSRASAPPIGSLDTDAYARSRGSSRSQDYGSYRSGGSSYGGRSYGGGFGGGRRGGGRRR